MNETDTETVHVTCRRVEGSGLIWDMERGGGGVTRIETHNTYNITATTTTI